MGMTTLALMATALFAQGAAMAPVEQDAAILVVARRFDETHGKLSRSVFSKKMTCTVSQSSGDAVIDDAVCNVAMTCIGKTKKRPAFLDCVAAGRQTFLDSYRLAERDDDAQN
ncbi:hypothetical protein [Sphingobium sp. KCTC 72723]|uniref:hypothetical protein n=1 Tax=Sphingobium sp. KCTC 72723 TaxID=2733867 RepID=UPI00165DF3E0|nr:hypothetical protein [Sphingobium sp. KCTC 72723]